MLCAQCAYWVKLKISVFMVTQPYVPKFTGETENFFWFSGKNIILCILQGEMSFKMHKIIFFQKKKNKKNMWTYRPVRSTLNILIFLFGLGSDFDFFVISGNTMVFL